MFVLLERRVVVLLLSMMMSQIVIMKYKQSHDVFILYIHFYSSCSKVVKKSIYCICFIILSCSPVKITRISLLLMLSVKIASSLSD